jgi:hypothetical protein
MRLLKLFLLLSLISAVSFAARGGGGGGSRGGGGGGARMGGGGGFRGGGGAFRGGTGFRGGFGGGRFIGGRVFGGFGLGFGYYGYGWPYYGGYYGYGYPYYDPYYSDPYSYSYTPYVSTTAPVQQPQYTAPQPAQPALSYYQAADFYLIAFNDHTIRAALSYTIQGDQIHWTSREHEEMNAPLSTVDRRFSEQINRDRHVEFRLP